MTDGPATVVLVHGAWCGQWIYWKLGPALDERGIPWVGADLPSCSTTDPSVGPIDDVAHVRELIDSVGGPVVAVGKSYGGAVITGACVGQSAVEHLVYLAALMPEAGEAFHQTVFTVMQPAFAAGLSALDDGRVVMDLEVGAALGFSAASEADRDVWRRNASPMSLGSDPAFCFDVVAWEHINSTYVVCERDKAIDPEAQRRWATRATHAVRRPFDHSPGVSDPDEVANLLAAVARRQSPAESD